VDDRFRGSASFEARPSQKADEANRSPEAIPQGRGPSPNVEFAIAPANDTVQLKDQSDQKKVASLQPRMQDSRERAVEPQAPPYRNNAAVERAGKKFFVSPKTIDAAVISIPGKQRVGPERAAMSARAALLEHSLDRIVLAAAPGG
jgi:hypothetical protein